MKEKELTEEEVANVTEKAGKFADMLLAKAGRGKLSEFIETFESKKGMWNSDAERKIIFQVMRDKLKEADGGSVRPVFSESAIVINRDGKAVAVGKNEGGVSEQLGLVSKAADIVLKEMGHSLGYANLGEYSNQMVRDGTFPEFLKRRNQMLAKLRAKA